MAGQSEGDRKIMEALTSVPLAPNHVIANMTGTNRRRVARIRKQVGQTVRVRLNEKHQLVRIVMYENGAKGEED